MYLYVYDEFVQDRRYERELALIETRLTDLGIAGKIARLALFRDVREVIRDEVRRGMLTVVAVGNDQTLRRIIDAVQDAKVVVGIIPLGPHNDIASILGVPTGVAACDVLSARLVDDVDAGSVNGMRFLHGVAIKDVQPRIRVEGRYTVEPARESAIMLRNLAYDEEFGAANPTDGKLELIMQTPRRTWLVKTTMAVTRVPFTELLLECPEETTLTIDGEELRGKTFDIRVLPRQLRMITGKERKYAA